MRIGLSSSVEDQVVRIRASASHMVHAAFLVDMSAVAAVRSFVSGRQAVAFPTAMGKALQLQMEW